MNNKISFNDLFYGSMALIRQNRQIFACFVTIMALGNYIFLRLSAVGGMFIPLHLFCLYLFYYLFFRVLFGVHPFWKADNFIKSAGKILIIFLLAFLSLMIIKIGFELLYFLAKSLAVFPDIYTFLTAFYAYLKSSLLIKLLLVAGLVAISIFTMFIPGFAWVATILEKEQSVLFSVLETKGNYLTIMSIYTIFYLFIPFFVTALLISLSVPFVIICFCSAFVSVFQGVMYAKLYETLFLHRLLSNEE